MNSCPPNSSLDTSAEVTALMTAGPVRNIPLILSTIKTKSPKAGE